MIEDIKAKLNIKGGMFIDMELEYYIKDIPQDKYLEFFRALSGDEFNYKNPMDRVAMIAKHFKQEKTDNLLAGTRELAKAMYDKFYSECCAMLDYTQRDRNKTPNDREFFRNVNYKELRRTDGTPTYTSQELYVLKTLGGGDWLIDIRLAYSAKEVVDKIEEVIKQATMTKYNQSQLGNSKVKGLIANKKSNNTIV